MHRSFGFTEIEPDHDTIMVQTISLVQSCLITFFLILSRVDLPLPDPDSDSTSSLDHDLNPALVALRPTLGVILVKYSNFLLINSSVNISRRSRILTFLYPINPCEHLYPYLSQALFTASLVLEIAGRLQNVSAVISHMTLP